MIIRNKVTGETKEIDPAQAGSYGVTPTPTPTPSSPSTTDQTTGFRLSDLLPAGTGLLGGVIGSILGPLGTVAGAGLGAAGGEGLRQTYRALTGTGPSVGQQDIGQPLKVGGVAAALATPVAGAQASLPYLKYLIHPTLLPFIGPKLESTISKAGEISPEVQTLLKEKLGSYANPNVETFAGKAPGAAESGVKALLKKEIGAVGRTAGGEQATPTYERLFQLRQGAYKAGYEKAAPIAQQEFYKQLGSIYKGMINMGVPETQRLDTLYKIASEYEKIPAVVRYSFGTALPLIIAYRLLGKLIPRL